MLTIQSLSSVGLGTYRMSSSYHHHLEALRIAVEHGCNLIDTATNYCQGTSEALIGAFIKAYPVYRDQLFVISKVGYVPAVNVRSATLSTFLEEQDLSIAHIDTDFEYSLDPAFIEFQLEQSLTKIGRDYLDVYLLHNPERLFQSKNLYRTTDLYHAVTQAFAFLETQVTQGKIRYYGISSNRLFDPTEAGSIDCRQLLEIAQSIEPNHHFKFLQFPFNFKERKALQTYCQDQSFLQWAKENGFVTIGNRPLNMNDNGLEFRLVTHEKTLQDWVPTAALPALNHFIEIVNAKIQALTDQQQTARNFEPIVLLEQHFSHFQGKEAVERFFNQQIQPFLCVVFEEDTAGLTALKPLVKAVQQHAYYHALNNQTQRTSAFLEELQQEGIPIKSNSALTACHAYIHHFKLDHVLVGLRKPTYVYALDSLLAYS